MQISTALTERWSLGARGFAALVVEPIDERCDVLDAELPLLDGAGDKRRRHIAAGRRAARKALVEAGGQPTALLRSHSGGVVWPTGWTGSITHCDAAAVAAVAPTTAVSRIGIDAEPAFELPSGVARHVFSATERRSLGRLQHIEPNVPWDTVFFCGKEALFKALPPTVQEEVGAFVDIEVDYSPTGGWASPHLPSDAHSLTQMVTCQTHDGSAQDIIVISFAW